MGSDGKLSLRLTLSFLLIISYNLVITLSSATNPSVAKPNQNDKKNILFLLPLSSKSHKNVFEPLIRGLAAKGHEITVLAATKSQNLPPNVKEIIIVKDDDIFDAWDDPLENRKKGKFGNIFMDISFALRVCDKVFESQEVQDLLKTHKNKFDLQYVDLILNQCFYGMLTYFEAPVITLSTMPPWNAVSGLMGTNLPSSFVPISFLNLPERMTFLQRVQNNLMNFIAPLLMRYYYNIRLEKVYQKHLGAHYPTAEEIEANASLMLTNSHFSLNAKMPLLPDIVEVGGMHLKNAKKLPQEFESFLEDAHDGFILFSLGSIVRARNMPEETRKTFLRVFGKLKQKVIWKWENDDMKDLPKNVKVSKWLPQQDLLGHPKIKLFMSHGGLLSTQEAVYHGVPMLGLPVFGDQDGNIQKAVSMGFALFQEILDVEEEQLLEKISKLLNDPKYSNKIKHLSKIIRDQPETPLERAIYWSEYVMRHGGAKHLRSPARDLNWAQYHSIDVMAFLLAIIILPIWLICWVCKRICCGGKGKAKMNGTGGNKKKVQ